MICYEVKSPTRVDLAGGTLDLWPLYNYVDGATTVNMAVNIMTHVELVPRQDSVIVLQSDDLRWQQSFKDLKECLKVLDEAFQGQDERLRLFQVQLEYWKPTGGFFLRTKSESPVGGGIGGSSSLMIGLLKAFDQLTRRSSPESSSSFKNIHDLVHVAHNLESRVLHTPTGTQDYYPAVSGGINILEYSADSIRQTVLPIVGSGIEDHLLLVYTGKPHHSGINNFEVLARATQKDFEVLSALRVIKMIADDTAAACRANDYMALPDLFRQESLTRKRLARSFSSPEIEKLEGLSLRAGAQAIKICGAGGGGCVLIWVPWERRKEVTLVCEVNGFKVLSAVPVPPIESHDLMMG